MFRRFTGCTFLVSLLLPQLVFANPDAIVIPNGDLRIKGSGSGLVFPDGSVQYKASSPFMINTVTLAVGDSGCPNGGVLLLTGKDTNGNGVLDITEVTASHNICNGAAGTNGAAGATGATGPAGPAGAGGVGFPWVTAVGRSQQASPNTGYLTVDALPVTVTLPASLSVGDKIQVTAVGTGGWVIAQNPGQTIVTNNLPLNPFSAIPVPASTQVSSMVSSADGTALMAASSYSGYVYRSSDSGVTWTSIPVVQSLKYLAGSSDLTKLVAQSYYQGKGSTYVSTDSGTTWILRNTLYGPVASSFDGGKFFLLSGRVFESSDYGVTWNQSDTAMLNGASIATSSDGTKVVVGINNGQIFTSSDSGVSWTARATVQYWPGIASSSDGTRLAALGSNSYSDVVVFTSSDAGETWTQQNVRLGSYYTYTTVVSSQDGKYLVVIGDKGFYVSMDFGQTWEGVGGSKAWASAVIPANSTAVYLTDTASQIYKYQLNKRTTVGVNGFLKGDQYSAIELQYIGNNTFNILSSNGKIVAN